MKTRKTKFAVVPLLSLQEEFVPSAALRGSAASVVARACHEPRRRVELLPLAMPGYFVRGRAVYESRAAEGSKQPFQVAISDYFKGNDLLSGK